jgi:DNA-binding response OmpR family regulator
MKRLFLLDDDDRMRARLGRAHANREYDVVEFGTPADVLQSMSAGSPDLLIAEVKSPETIGIDLVEKLRRAGERVPVILVAADPTGALESRALRFADVRVVTPPGEAVAEFCAAVRGELYGEGVEEAVREMDCLRTEFLTELSHQLRTPVTAMKLAFDGLFVQLRDVMDPSQRKLARISSRNVERIVTLVENQLDLLQMIAGERRVSRRLVDLNDLARRSPKSGPSCGGKDAGEIKIELSRAEGPLYLFTDPDHLSSIVDCLLGLGPPDTERTLRVGYDQCGDCTLEVEVAHPQAQRQTEEEQPCGISSVSVFDFEHRAYQSMLDRLGGRVNMHRDADRKWARIALPRVPAFDKVKDFLNPIRTLRAYAEKAGRAVTFVRCDLGEMVGPSYLDDGGRSARDFLQRVTAGLSESDIVIRGRSNGTLYLVLLERSADELGRLTAFLEGGADAGRLRESGLFVRKPQTVIHDPREIDRFVGELELV